MLHRAGKHYALAIEGYTKAIDLNPNSAVYYSNRAFAHIKLEAYGAAITDATKSIELEPAYVKVRQHVEPSLTTGTPAAAVRTHIMLHMCCSGLLPPR